MPVHLEGKQSPCPECKRIIRVPLQKKKAPVDWRKSETIGGGLLRKDSEDAPEGAWGSATSATTVSRESLVQADAVPQLRPTSRVQPWLQRGLVAVVVLGVGYWLYAAIAGYFTQRAQDQALERVLEYFPEGKAPKIQPSTAAAEVLRALGEYYLHAGEMDQARIQLAGARELVRGVKGNERDALLVDVAEIQAGMVLDPAEIENSQSSGDAELAQRKAFRELSATIGSMNAVAAQREGLRRITPLLLAKRQESMAATIASQFPNRAEMLAVVGLEIARQGDKEKAESMAELASKQVTSSSAPSLTALWLVLDQPAKADALAAKWENDKKKLWQLGSVEGLAQAGKLDQARNMMTQLPESQQLLALARLVAITLEQGSSETRDLDGLVKELASYQGNAPTELEWPLWRVVRLAGQAKHFDAAKKLASAIADLDLRGRAHLEILRVQLDHSDQADPKLAADIPAKSPAYKVAHETIARHNARLGYGDAMVDSWEKQFQPFGNVGAVLGIQDRR